MRTEQLGEKFRLRLAQLRKLLCDMGDRAVVLAQLLALLGVGCVPRGSSVPVRAQGPGQRFGALLGRGGLDRLAVRARLGGDPGAGEGGDRLLPALPLGDPAHGVDGQLVVRLVEGVAAAVGEREDLGGPATRARAVDPLLAGLHHVVGDQRVEVAPDGGLGEPQTPGELGDGGRPVVQDGARDAVAGGPLTGREFLLRSLANVFHNAIVA